MRILKFLLPAAILALLTVGVTTHSVPLMYAGIISVCIVVVLVAFGVLKEPTHPYLLFAIALGMVFQLTLAGSNLVGPDVHLEYYWAQFYAGGNVWYPLRDYCPAAGLGAVFFAPMLQKIGIPLIWTFKVIFPICFAFVPIILYHLFSRWVDRKKSFIAAFAFIAFPSFLLEMPGITEGMLAELFMVVAMYLVIVDKFRLRYRILLIIVCGLLAGFTHYSFAFILIPYLCVAFFIRIVLHIRNGLPHKAMAGICAIVLVGSLIFFSAIASGMIMVKISGIYNSWVPAPARISMWTYSPINEQAPKPLELLAKLPHPIDTSAFIPEKEEDALLKPWDTPEVSDITPDQVSGTVEAVIETDTETTIYDVSTGEIIKVIPKAPTETRPWFERYHNLMETALGLDFAQIDTAGKAFRISLWATGLCMLVGLFLLRKNKEFWIFAAGAIILAGACLHPRVSPILNASRFVHFALIILIPTIAVGGRWIFRNLGVFTICIIVPYFLFTSGFIFEVMRCNSDTIGIPYSFGLSNQRIDLGASVTENDMEVVRWLAEHKSPNDDIIPWPLFADLPATTTLNEVIGYRPDLLRAWYKHSHLMPKPPWYAFIRERNVQDGTVIIYSGIGQRGHYPFSRLRIDIDKNIIYQVGEARVIYVDAQSQWDVLEKQRLALRESGEELSPEVQRELTSIRAVLRDLEADLAKEEIPE